MKGSFCAEQNEMHNVRASYLHCSVQVEDLSHSQDVWNISEKAFDLLLLSHFSHKFFVFIPILQPYINMSPGSGGCRGEALLWQTCFKSFFCPVLHTLTSCMMHIEIYTFTQEELTLQLTTITVEMLGHEG